jgi:PAS domain S-box-containing protein
VPQAHPDPVARLAAIVSSTGDAILSRDLSGIITSWNPAAERLFGFTAASAIGQPIAIVIPEDRLPEEDYLLEQVKAGRAVSRHDTIRRRQDGTAIEVSLTVSPILDDAGQLIGASTIARQIADHRPIEREAYWLAAIVASSEDAIVSKDLQGVIQSWNRGAERIFGYTAEEVIGRPITIIIPEERITEEDHVLSKIRRGEVIEHFETVRRRRDGSHVEISLTVSPIRSATGTILGASKIARDISEQKRLQRVAEEASRMQDEFLAVLSHELRTPLNTVLGYARMLRRPDAAVKPEQQARALDVLERNADVLAKLVNDLLDTSRIVTGKLRLALETFPLDEVVRDAIETIRPGIDAKHVTIHVSIPKAVEVLGDRDRMRQVVWNLLSNASKFTPTGGQIHVRVGQEGSIAEIEVRDTGVGIQREDLPLIFQRFWQADTGTAREFGGLGIGLALARHLVELHGGSIVAQSEGPGKGAVFLVRLPAEAVSLPRERTLRRVGS